MPRWLVVAILILVSIGFVLTSPETAEQCEAGDALQAAGAYAAALKQYEAALDASPLAECAAKGVKAVADARCDIAVALESRGQSEAAASLYKSLAEGDAGSCFASLAGQPTYVCETGDALLDRGLYASAQKAYEEMLDRRRLLPACAVNGLAEITDARCRIVDELQAQAAEANAAALQKSLAEGNAGSCFDPIT